MQRRTVASVHLGAATALVVVLAVLAPGGVPAAALDNGRGSFETSAGERTFDLHVPDDLDPETSVPLLLVFHGSGRDGRSLVRKWDSLADRHGFVVAGLDAADPEVWAVPADGPEVVRELVEHLTAELPIDRRRMYLFGHSAGASFALQMSLLESRYFAATAIHAGFLREGDDWMISGVGRKIPLHLASGDRDEVVPFPRVERTHRVLEEAGFPVELVEMKYHGHWYYDLAKKINKRAWEFLQGHRLEAEPRWEGHRFR